MGTLDGLTDLNAVKTWRNRSEEHTSELQSQSNLVCRLLLEKKNIKRFNSLSPAHLLVLLPGRGVGSISLRANYASVACRDLQSHCVRVRHRRSSLNALSSEA